MTDRIDTASGSAAPTARRRTVAVRVSDVVIGGGAPVVVQSMTNTDTADVEGTARQVAALAHAGSELVRITVDRDEAAAAVPRIRDRLSAIGVAVPLIGDFHYIGHKLLAEYPACAVALDATFVLAGRGAERRIKAREFFRDGFLDGLTSVGKDLFSNQSIKTIQGGLV